MWKKELCIGMLGGTDLTDEEMLGLIKKVGFDAYFANWADGRDLVAVRDCGDSLGLRLQSVHAPFNRMDSLWYPDERTEPTVQRLLKSFCDSAEVGAPIVVIHPFITFTRNQATQAGIDHYGVLIEEAGKLGIKLAIENVEGESYLDALMEAYKDQSHVGFCWDTGHEMCYNRHRDLLADYGDRLLCTHLNDNLGIKSPEGLLTFHDDLHLLPFDGIADWQGIADRLVKWGFDGPLTFELKLTTTLNGCKLPIYGDIDVERYLTYAYMRACRVAALMKV